MEINNTVLDHGQLSSSLMEAISFFVKTAPFNITLKNAHRKTYVQTSSSAAKSIGVASSDDLIGLTANEIFTSYYSYGACMPWIKKEPENIEEHEYQVKSTNFIATRRHIFFTIEGFLLLINSIKIPIVAYSNSHCVTAILSFDQDLTLQRGLSGLLELYRKYYPERQAIQQLLRYLKLDTCFTEQPTLQEVKLLFEMRKRSTHKYLAAQLDLAHGTLESYLSKLRNKLTVPDLYSVLIPLRAIPLDERDMYGCE